MHLSFTLAGVEDILVKPRADHKRGKIIEESTYCGTKVSASCKEVLVFVLFKCQIPALCNYSCVCIGT